MRRIKIKIFHIYFLYYINNRSKLWSLADKYEIKGDRGSALIIYKIFINSPLIASLDFYYAALSLSRLNKFDLAFEMIDKGLNKYPGDKNIYYCLKEIALISGHLDAYIVKYDKKNLPFEIKNLCVRMAEQPEYFQRYLLNINRLSQSHAKQINQQIISCWCASKFDIKILLQASLSLRSSGIIANYFIFFDNFIREIIKKDRRFIHVYEFISRLSLPLQIPSSAYGRKLFSTYDNNIEYLLRKSLNFNDPLIDLKDYHFAPWQSVFCFSSKKFYYKTIILFEKLCFKIFPQLNYIAPHTKLKLISTKKNKIRIGFNVLDSMPMMSGLLLHLDQNLFESFYLCPGSKTKSIESKLWFKRANKAVVYSSTNLRSAIKTIADQKLDIIISGPCVPEIFYPMLARLASLQMILLEPNWMDGSKNLDYYISWKTAEPKNPNTLYKSKVAFLDRPPYWIESPASFQRTYSRSELNHFRNNILNIKTQQKVYLCANTLPKIHPKMDDAFKAILDKDKLAVLVFLRCEHSIGDILKERLRLKLGKNFMRVIFLPTLSQADAHSLLLSADCCLDSFPINGMSSSFDASILGVPIVTFPHNNPFGSWTAAIYKHIAIDGLVAKSTKEYVNISLKLASNKFWRSKISSDIKNRSSVFIENESAAADFQNFILKAWDRKCKGMSPQSYY